MRRYRRSLLDRLSQTFKGLSPDEISSLITVKDDVFIIKIRTHSGAVANVYSTKTNEGEVPMFFAVEDGFFPTGCYYICSNMQTLWLLHACFFLKYYLASSSC